MMVIISHWRIYHLRIPYGQSVRWAEHEEDSCECILLELQDAKGIRGVAELCIREKWLGETASSVARALDGFVLPALKDRPIDAARILELIPPEASAVARALIDCALLDMRCAREGKPLWQLLGAQSHSVPVSCTIARNDPDIMAAQAWDWRARHGVNMFKIKTGQGLVKDRAALAALRDALDADVSMSIDSNSADKAEDVPAMMDMAHMFGVSWFEDPCRLLPDESFQKLQDAAPLPILVDNACRSLERAQQFMARGARGLSVKLAKTGVSESLAIADIAGRGNVPNTGLAVGISASTSLGAVFSLALSAALPESVRCMACEETFFLCLAGDLLKEPLTVGGGKVEIPSVPSLHALVDWANVRKFAV